MLTYLLDFGGVGVASGVRLIGTERYRTTGSTDFGVNTVISVWYRREDLDTNNQVIIGSQDEIETDQGPVSVRTWAIRATQTGIDFVSVYANTGVPRTIVAAGFGCIRDQNWHHALFRFTAWSGAFPGNFAIEFYHDGVFRGTHTQGGPSTYFHDNAVYQGLADLGYIYQAASTGYPTEPFDGDIAQVWIGTNNTFRIGDYFSGGPVGLGATGVAGGIVTAPDIYDRVDFPFESGTVMQNISTRSTRTPVITDAADGISWDNRLLSDSEILSTRSASNDNIFPGRYEFGWGDITRNTYNTVSLETPTVYRAIKINQPGFYRVNFSGTIARNPFTPAAVVLELRSGYSPFINSSVDSGTAVIVVNTVTTSESTVSFNRINEIVYLENYLGLVFQVIGNTLEWDASDVALEILTV